MEFCWRRKWPCVVLCYLVWLICAKCAHQPLRIFGSLSPSHLFPEPRTVAHLNYAFSNMEHLEWDMFTCCGCKFFRGRRRTRKSASKMMERYCAVKKKKKKTILIVESTISKETENSDLYKNTKACLDP